MQNATPLVIAVLTAELLPAAAFGFAAERVTQTIRRLPFALRVLLPALLVLPYAVMAEAQHMLRVIRRLWPVRA